MGSRHRWVGRVIAPLVMTLAATLEGASLGYSQWRALRAWLPDLSLRRFVGATIVVAAGGWFIGMRAPRTRHQPRARRI